MSDATPAPRGVDRDPRRVEAMFSRIAVRYDLMNRVMTAGLDGRWREVAARQAGLHPGDAALDACCGTGDLTLALARMYPESAVFGVDFSPTMLARAREKAARRGRGTPPSFVAGDLLELPFPDGAFAAVTVAFGVRNVPDLRRAFREMGRVTRPGGRVVCLEITMPEAGVGRRFHRLWFEKAVPAIGALVSGDGHAYAYLPASVRDFPSTDGLAAIMCDAGLAGIRHRRLGLGMIALHVGTVRGGEAHPDGGRDR